MFCKKEEGTGRDQHTKVTFLGVNFNKKLQSQGPGLLVSNMGIQ